MKKTFTNNAWIDYLYWQENDRKIVKRINDLLKDIERNGNTEGIGKPEPLKHDLSGYFSRRINEEHRIIYRADSENDTIEILQCRHHYNK